MTLDINLVSAPELHDFQQLLTDKLPQLFSEIPAGWKLTQTDGAVYILLEEETNTHIIAADPRDGSRAIFAALACVNHHKLPDNTRITLLSPYQSPSVHWLCQHTGVRWQRILVVSIDGEKGILIDTAFTARKSMGPESAPPATLTRTAPASDSLPRAAAAKPGNATSTGVSAPLTKEEEAFFQHL